MPFMLLEASVVVVGERGGMTPLERLEPQMVMRRLYSLRDSMVRFGADPRIAPF